jgi:hypothetical protein
LALVRCCPSAARPEALHLGELALEQLASAADGARRVARGDESRGAGRIEVADAGAHLLLQDLTMPAFSTFAFA